MKLYYLWDEKFEVLKNNFLSSIKDPFELYPIQIPTPQFDHNTHHEKKWAGGPMVWQHKISSVIEAIDKLPENEIFILSDIDIVFYNEVIPTVQTLIKNKDVLFLAELASGISNWQGGNINFGFNVIRCNNKTRRFFCDVLDEVKKTEVLEQKIINQYLYRENDYQLEWSLLPLTFLSTTVGHHHITKDLRLFHANCASFIKDKFDLIQKANDIYFSKK